MKIGSLCSGYGGLDLAVEELFDADTAWHCEFEDAPSKILEAHWDVPNHRDLTQVDWESVEAVDIVTAGWPCQPWSAAGAQKGEADERAIWPSVADAIRRLRPGWVVLENVPAIIVLGELARAVGDLASFGYDAQWQCVRASDVGAPHRRDRCFIVARDTYRLAGPENFPFKGRSREVDKPGTVERTLGSDGAPTVANTEGVSRVIGNGDDVRVGCGTVGQDATAGASATPYAGGLQSERWRGDANLARSQGAREGQGQEREWNGDAVDDSGSVAATDWGLYSPAIRRWELATGRTAPAPSEPGPGHGSRLSALLVEWMMGLPAGWVTGVGITRNEQLKALGNGVVPQQAYAAISTLVAE